jgi:malonyl-CoA O-methyltransferase
MRDKRPSKTAAFCEKAFSYDAHAIVQKEAADWLAKWLPEPNEFERCLELGAGTGLFTEHLIERFAHLEVSDASSAMLEVCNRRAPGLHQRTRNAWTQQNDPQSWDYLTSSSLLQWAPNPKACLGYWKALLREGGRILCGFFADPSLPEMNSILEGESPVTWRSTEKWIAAVESNGLNVKRIEVDTRRYNYESPLHFWKSLHGTGATVSQRMQPSQMLSLFRNYEARFSNDFGVYATWTFCRLEISLD